VIATGSRAVFPKIAGLDPSKSLTNETIFQLRDRPDHLVIIGGGPIGIEMAVAHRRLGARVTVIERAAILPHDEPELVEELRGVLRAEGISVLEQADIASVEHGPASVVVHIKQEWGDQAIAGSHLLVAAGREPVLEDLGLDAAGIAYDQKGIVVDKRLRSNRRHVFALGDVIDAPHFTHVAGYQAGIVVRNLAFRWPAKVDYETLPWVTYTDPELAHVGMTEAQARKRYGDAVSVQRVALRDNDRAVAERRVAGSIKVIVGARGRILGVSILAPAAGEMIGLWCLAIKQRLSLRAITDLMLPYPTMGEIGKTAASRYYQPLLFSDRSRRLVGGLQWLPQW
jgi:pyruvate/2-oxoglutarate dehydrogenase complex dihydrolipoamide dehydrogenase (E3) component